MFHKPQSSPLSDRESNWSPYSFLYFISKRIRFFYLQSLAVVSIFVFTLGSPATGTTNEESVTLKILPLISPQKSDDPWWQPSPETSWQIQLTGFLDRNFDVDMYDVDLHYTSIKDIKNLHDDGRIVICYFSAGTWEDFRPDSNSYPKEILGTPMVGWEDEYWLDIRQVNTLGPILEARMDEAVQRGCDGIDPDNVDGYTHDTGFNLTAENQLTFNKWLAEQAHERGLSIGLKNDLDQVDTLVNHFDWALNESCFHFSAYSDKPECVLLLPFINAGKAVFGIEYTKDLSEFCDQANEYGLSFIKKNWDLDVWRQACR